MWPRDNQNDLIDFYGDPETGAVGPNLVRVIPPFRMTYDGTPVPHLMFHRLAAPALERALKTVWDYYGRDQSKIDALGISKTAGTYNHRKISGSDKWSNHAYGAAIDINAEENGFNVEGNIPLPMIAAFKAEGARWGGDYRGRTDPMHFEFCASGEPVRTFDQWLAFYGVPSDAAPPTGARMRFTGITATVFGGPTDSMSGSQTAYGATGAWWERNGVALPFRFSGARPRVRVQYQGRSVECEILDVGPWNINDPYWQTGSRPQAETGTDTRGRRTNLAGIDLTPAAANAIGLPGKGLVDWDFVGAAAQLPPPPPQTPGHTMPPPDTATPYNASVEDCIIELAKAQRPILERFLRTSAPMTDEEKRRLVIIALGGVPPASAPVLIPPPLTAPPPPVTAPPTATTTPPAAPPAATSPTTVNVSAAIAGVLASLGLSATGVIGAPVGPDATMTGMLLPLLSMGAGALGIPAPVVNIIGTLLSKLFAPKT